MYVRTYVCMFLCLCVCTDKRFSGKARWCGGVPVVHSLLSTTAHQPHSTHLMVVLQMVRALATNSEREGCGVKEEWDMGVRGEVGVRERDDGCDVSATMILEFKMRE